jgi:hypothetical protein
VHFLHHCFINIIMGLTQSAEDEEIIFQVLDSVFGRDNDVRPIDECACYNEDGSFNIREFEAYLDRESDESSAKMRVVFLMLQVFTEARAKAAMDPRAAAEEEPLPKKTRVRQVKTFTDPSSGNVVSMTARHSLWWILYVQQPKVDCPQWNKVFRKRFRLPYHSFLILLAMLKDDNHANFFERWQEDRPDKQFRKIKASPIELLLLGSLRYLGRGWTFDDLEESTFITREVHRVFFISLLNLDPKFCTQSMSLCLQHWKSSEIVNQSIGQQGFQDVSAVLTQLTSPLRRSRTA